MTPQRAISFALAHFKNTLGATLVDAKLNEGLRTLLMTPEQRAVKWFEKVPQGR